jgi:hypothetical protein
MEIDLNNEHWGSLEIWISLNSHRVTLKNGIPTTRRGDFSYKKGAHCRQRGRRSGGGRHHGGLGVSEAGIAGAVAWRDLPS